MVTSAPIDTDSNNIISKIIKQFRRDASKYENLSPQQIAKILGVSVPIIISALEKSGIVKIPKKWKKIFDISSVLESFSAMTTSGATGVGSSSTHLPTTSSSGNGNFVATPSGPGYFGGPGQNQFNGQYQSGTSQPGASYGRPPGQFYPQQQYTGPPAQYRT